MKITVQTESLSIPLIVDGTINEGNLKFIKKDRKWLENQIKNNNIDRVEDVLFAQLESTGQVYMDKKDKDIKTPKFF